MFKLEETFLFRVDKKCYHKTSITDGTMSCIVLISIHYFYFHISRKSVWWPRRHRNCHNGILYMQLRNVRVVLTKLGCLGCNSGPWGLSWLPSSIIIMYYKQVPVIRITHFSGPIFNWVLTTGLPPDIADMHSSSMHSSSTHIIIIWDTIALMWHSIVMSATCTNTCKHDAENTLAAPPQCLMYM